MDDFFLSSPTSLHAGLQLAAKESSFISAPSPFPLSSLSTSARDAVNSVIKRAQSISCDARALTLALARHTDCSQVLSAAIVAAALDKTTAAEITPLLPPGSRPRLRAVDWAVLVRAGASGGSGYSVAASAAPTVSLTLRLDGGAPDLHLSVTAAHLHLIEVALREAALALDRA
jgi:hypothetical protein